MITRDCLQKQHSTKDRLLFILRLKLSNKSSVPNLMFYLHNLEAYIQYVYLFSSDRLSMKKICSILYELYFQNLFHSHLKSSQTTSFLSLRYNENQLLLEKTLQVLSWLLTFDCLGEWTKKQPTFDKNCIIRSKQNTDGNLNTLIGVHVRSMEEHNSMNCNFKRQ